MFRKIISLTIAISFIVLLVTGVLSFFKEYARITASIHTVFGLLFSTGVFFHFINNFRPFKAYLKKARMSFLLLPITLVFLGTYYQTEPFNSFMNFGAKSKANSEKLLNLSDYQILEMDTTKEVHLTIDLLRSEHYWNPQMAIWLEDPHGRYLETLYVSKTTAKGLFFGGRSKETFKEFDKEKVGNNDYRRVNALPVWSHKRGVQYEDGLYVPTREKPLTDAITGETMTNNFKLLTSIDSLTKFTLRIEINVAFDDNEFFSEYDFPDDEVFHSGTGQLGQPSIIFDTQIDMHDGKNYYLMELIGHGHQSGQTGDIYKNLSTLTTAKKIIERIVVGVK